MLHEWVSWEVDCLICALACTAADICQAFLCEPSFHGSGASSEVTSTEEQESAWCCPRRAGE